MNSVYRRPEACFDAYELVDVPGPFAAYDALPSASSPVRRLLLTAPSLDGLCVPVVAVAHERPVAHAAANCADYPIKWRRSRRRIRATVTATASFPSRCRARARRALPWHLEA